MKVSDLMTSQVESCDLNASLAQAAKLMWDNDCGILPVLKDGIELVGVITDRDICMATAIKDRHAADISVEEVITGKVYSTTPDDDVHQALETMGQHKVRRLPVIGSDGTLKGILSMNDIVLRSKESHGKKEKLTFADVVNTYKSICEHPKPTVKAASAPT